MTRRQGSRLAQLGMLLLVLGLLTSFAAAPAVAQSLEELRASGAVGERFDGYAAVHDPSVAGASQVVQQVNQKRRGIYEQRAAAQGVSVDQIGRVYAGEIIKKAPRGTWILDENGNWRRK